MRYEFAPAGVTPTTNNEFYIYVSHYRADPGAYYAGLRLGEATIIRNDESTNLPANARVLYVGDYNPDNNSGEPGYQTICSNSAPDGVQQGQGVDPLNIDWGPYTSAATNIDWSDPTTNPAILFMLTESAKAVRYRDDLQVMTSNVYYDVAGGLQYVPGTFHTFGNNASLPYGSSVTANGNTALNDLDPVLTNRFNLPATTLYLDLTNTTDHLPVVADYTIPVDAYACWRQFYFGYTTSPNGAPGTDADGTGMSNSNKFLAGFNPTNSAAYLHIISVAASNNNVMVTYLGASGDTNWSPGFTSRTNVLDFATGDASGNYTNGGWQDTGQTNILGAALSINGGTGLGTVTNMTDVGGATNSPSRYYRVRVLLP
jgi:hypothetical protein